MKLWVKFIKDYESLAPSVLPSYSTGQSALVSKDHAVCLVEMGYAEYSKAEAHA